MTASASPPGCEVPRRLAEQVRDGEREQQEPDETTSSQRLTPIPGVSQRRRFIARSSSRWKTATGPRSCSRSQAASASAMAIERW